uniref:Uncharacterized protein n=1 Tax=Romanomermis culicivorax TaxID=13658 RepID=A0A915L686_ROMCU
MGTNYSPQRCAGSIPYNITDSLWASSQSSELQLALPALPLPTAASTPALETRIINQSTAAANMVIPSKGIASLHQLSAPA